MNLVSLADKRNEEWGERVARHFEGREYRLF